MAIIRSFGSVVGKWKSARNRSGQTARTVRMADADVPSRVREVPRTTEVFVRAFASRSGWPSVAAFSTRPTNSTAAGSEVLGAGGSADFSRPAETRTSFGNSFSGPHPATASPTTRPAPRR